MNILSLFIYALILTILCEFCVLLLIIQKNPVKIAFIAILINLVTNPLMNYLLLIHEVPVFVLELFVICCEAIMITYLLRISLRYALICSILMNGISWMAGILIRMAS